MLQRYVLPFFALLGAIVALMVTFWSEKTAPIPFIPFPPPTSPYSYAISAEGITEASSYNLSIGSPFSEIVSQIPIIEGDIVQKGDLLFALDTRSLEAQKATLEKKLELSFIKLKEQEIIFSFYDHLEDKNAVSQEAYTQALYALQEAREEVHIVEAEIQEVETSIERSFVRAPIDGKILQVNIHLGEVAPNVPPASAQAVVPYGSSQYPLILMGSIDPLYLRIDIDEEDAWRYQKGAPGRAFVRGNSHISLPLSFVRIEPYILPKASFNGDTTQRIDTRVLQVIYKVETSSSYVPYTGQMLDVFLETNPLPTRKDWEER